MAINSDFLHAGCNKCGASLELPPGLRFVTCQFCGSRLEVRFAGGVAYADVLDASSDGDRQIAHDLQLIKLQNELNRLDQEWALEREQYREHDRYGGSRMPTAGNTARSVLFGILGVAFGIFWITMGSSNGAPQIFPIFGLAFIGVAVVTTFRGIGRHNQYGIAAARYEGKRRRLLCDLEAVEFRQGTITRAVPESVSP